jgi:hypothetical protein
MRTRQRRRWDPKNKPRGSRDQPPAMMLIKVFIETNEQDNRISSPPLQARHKRRYERSTTPPPAAMRYPPSKAAPGTAIQAPHRAGSKRGPGRKPAGRPRTGASQIWRRQAQRCWPRRRAVPGRNGDGARPDTRRTARIGVKIRGPAISAGSRGQGVTGPAPPGFDPPRGARSPRRTRR